MAASQTVALEKRDEEEKTKLNRASPWISY
jgi:hypothetical protein